MGWPTPASSSELEPARLGLPASLEVEEDGTVLGRGNVGGGGGSPAAEQSSAAMTEGR